MVVYYPGKSENTLDLHKSIIDTKRDDSVRSRREMGVRRWASENIITLVIIASIAIHTGTLMPILPELRIYT